MASDSSDIPLSRYRNIGIMAHIDAGKTTTTERILFYTGTIHKMGEVHEGTTTTDWMPQERERGITITAAAISCFWNRAEHGYRLNLIDTPGHVDFTIEVERSLRVLDGTVAVFDGVNGVEPQSETVWRQADKHRVPRICFINKMDRVGADFAMSVASIRDRLGARPLVLQLPLGIEEHHRGVIDLVTMKALTFHDDVDGSRFDVGPIPDAFALDAAQARRTLLEQVAEIDDSLTDAYLTDEGASLTEAQLRGAIRKGCIGLHIAPVLCGSAYRHKGVQPLLDAVVDYLPSPLDVPPIVGTTIDGNPTERRPDVNAPFAALAFKLVTEAFGTLTYIRVYSGTLKPGSAVWNPRTKKRERVGKLLQMRAEKREELESCGAGDICAIVGLKNAITGDTLCAESHPLLLERIEFPDPVIQLALEPKSTEDAEKLAPALQKIAMEDPSFHTMVDAETGQTIIAGMGELHLEIVIDRLLREHRVSVTVGRPQVAYRETITKSATSVAKHVRQSAAKNQFAQVKLRVAPRKTGAGFLFTNALPAGAVPAEFQASIQAGIEASLGRGVIAGYPLIDIAVEAIDGAAHPTDSDEQSFQIASSTAFREACAAASPTLLEPVMEVEIVVPADYMGSVIGDLNSRRGIIQGMAPRGPTQQIDARVPLSEMFGYVDSLRTLTQGRGTYTMQFGAYESIPEPILKPLLLRMRGY